jgi:hypothetical protein
MSYGVKVRDTEIAIEIPGNAKLVIERMRGNQGTKFLFVGTPDQLRQTAAAILQNLENEETFKAGRAKWGLGGAWSILGYRPTAQEGARPNPSTCCRPAGVCGSCE